LIAERANQEALVGQPPVVPGPAHDQGADAQADNKGYQDFREAS